MAASRMDVARRLSAFEFACHAMDVAFSEVHCLPRIPRPALRDRGNPMELYDEEQFHARYRFTKNAVRQLRSKKAGTTEDSLCLPCCSY
ncbi:hypothetical protein HPB52_005481 [Rhipicephalus sanguineus]|uniref:Uncharacterized protein n=1 Tax=Rhipicephalus sanguineus TaxID=34632 RepID=A0A9D4PZJ5_RHISA|nr:hypothetical protein HPB52_005481 [Rhipicephalus sanguineus]